MWTVLKWVKIVSDKIKRCNLLFVCSGCEDVELVYHCDCPAVLHETGWSSGYKWLYISSQPSHQPKVFSSCIMFMYSHAFSIAFVFAGRCNNVQAADIVFLVDGSSSIGRANFLQVKGFMAGIVKPFDSSVSETGIRFGAIQYSDTSRWLTGLIFTSLLSFTCNKELQVWDLNTEMSSHFCSSGSLVSKLMVIFNCFLVRRVK